MSALEQNPYAPPFYHAHSAGILFSRHITQTKVGLFILVVVQLMTGVATAFVVSNEGLDARSFVVGIALFTMVFSALVSCAGAPRWKTEAAVAFWAVGVTVVAWIAWLIGFWCTEIAAIGQSTISQSEFGQLGLMAGMTAAFVTLFLKRVTAFQASYEQQ